MRKELVMKKLKGAAKLTHQIYTVEGGIKNHDAKEQTKGIMLLAGIVVCARSITRLIDKIEHLEIKATRKR